MKAVLFLGLFAALAVTVYSQSTASGAAASCDAACSGVTGVSCLYCPSCGSCSSVGVIDHCYAAGTALISFDDGPNQYTAKQLDILKSLGIKGAFWIIGQNINADLSYPAVVKRIVDEGHLVGSHTQTHVSLNTITSAAVTAEMTQSVTAIQNAVGNGYVVKYMRPPNGELNTPVRTQVQGMNIMPVMWNTDTQDLLYGSTADNMIANVTDVLAAYSRRAHSLIILMHALSDYSISTLTTIISNVQKAGYTFVDAPTCFDSTTAGPTANSTEPVQCVHPPTSMGYQGCSTTFGCANVQGGSCCSHYSSCGSTEDFCGVGCLNGACDVCVQGGYIPSKSLFATTVGGSTSTTGSSSTPAAGSTGSGSTTTTSGSTGGSTSTPTTIAKSGAATTSTQLVLVLGGAAVVTAVSMYFARKSF